MWFGELPTSESEGCILAHSIRLASGRITKGTLLSKALLAVLQQGGCERITVARLDKSDVHEDDAAAMLATAVAGHGVRIDRANTGRVNLYASHDGLLSLNREALCELNGIDESVTLATLAENSWVLAGKMIATSKIITYAVTADDIKKAAAIALQNKICVHASIQKRALLLQTTLPAVKESTLDKTRVVTEQRLRIRRAELVDEMRCPHTVDDLMVQLREALQYRCDWILIAGASAISDRRDVIPAAIEEVGGRVIRYGIPVDPGNLLLLGDLNGTAIIGMPGCARSPKYNGLDQLLDRLACGVEVTDLWLNSLGVGGLLTEMVDRPQPRVAHSQPAVSKPKVAGLVLAAGSSRRAGNINKLLQPYNGLPMVRTVVNALCDSDIDQVLVVTGFEREKIEEAISETRSTSHYCASHAMGLAHSLSHGISRLKNIDAVLVCLGDMPHITSVLINQLVSKAASNADNVIAVPVVNGKRGNPVMVGNAFFDTLLQHSGDSGARFLMTHYPDRVVEIPVDDESVLLDYDTPEALATLQ